MFSGGNMPNTTVSLDASKTTPRVTEGQTAIATFSFSSPLGTDITL